MSRPNVGNAAKGVHEKLIISESFIHQQNSWAPLDASKEMLIALSNHYGFSPSFYHILSSFRDRRQESEKAFSGVVRVSCTGDTYGMNISSILMGESYRLCRDGVRV